MKEEMKDISGASKLNAATGYYIYNWYLFDKKRPFLHKYIIYVEVAAGSDILYTLSFCLGELNAGDLLKFCFRMKGDVGKKQAWWKYSCNTQVLESLLQKMLGENTKMEEKKTK